MQNASSPPPSGPLAFRINFNGAVWCLREVGAVFDVRRDPSREMLFAYAEGLMRDRTGRLVVEKQDGSIDFERGFDPARQAADDAATSSSPAVETSAMLEQIAAQLKAVRVIIEERRIGLEMSPETWCSREYVGLEKLPKLVPPAFPSSGTEAAQLDLVQLLSSVCAARKEEARFEAPYHEGEGRHKKTILRSVVFQVKLRSGAA